MRVILDTNALMIPSQFKVDIFENLEKLGYSEAIVPTSVMRELERLMKTGKGKEKMQASIAIKLAARCKIVASEGRFDEEIGDLAKQFGAAVLTNDSKLRKDLRSKNVKTLYLRERCKLESD